MEYVDSEKLMMKNLKTLVVFLFFDYIHCHAELNSILKESLDKYVPNRKTILAMENKRQRRQIQSAEPGAIMYLPIGGSGNIR